MLGSPPEARRLDKTYIDLNGPSLRVIDLSRMGGPPQAQLVAAPKPFMAAAGQIGQVFALALDDASPPNIYAAATSAYGLPIVVPDTDGDGHPDRTRRGAANAAFMPGLFGPITANGGPGSIWKINGVTGAVTLFANVTLAGVPNSGPALGGLAFDRGSRQLFVADRDTGMIHRFTLDGVDRGRFDHGVQALAAAGLPPIAFDPRKRLNIESSAFDSGNPATWAYAPPARRIFGLAVSGGRLYYAVAAGLRIWSVSLLPDGSFGADARFEVAVPRGAAAAGAEISEILFDDNGDMLVAERGTPTGTYDYKALAEAGENRVLRFRPKLPDDPPSRDLWFPVPKEYAIGFPQDYRNDNGGIAIGYGYDAAGNINRAVCGGTLWSTGEQLRNARDRDIIRRLQTGGPLIVDGLQGNSTRLLRPLNEPPFETYFIDYDDRFDDPPARGHLGDVVIWRVCGQAALPGVLALPIVCPVGWFNIGGICQAGLACPPGTEFANGCCGYRGCPPSYARVGGRCVPPPMNCGEGETYSEGRCQAPRCPPGLVPVGRKIAKGDGPPRTNGDCGPGEIYTNEHCEPAPGTGPKMCSGSTYCKCPDGTQPNGDGTCKQSSCGPHMVEGDGTCLCEPGYQDVVDSNGQNTCIPVSQCDQSPALCCPAGLHWNTTTHSCDLDNQNPTPKLQVTKTFASCCRKQDTAYCKFSFSIKNIGSTPFSGPVHFYDAGNGQLGITGGTGGQVLGVTLAPGEAISGLGPLGDTYTPGSKFLNCISIAAGHFPRPPNNSEPPGPDISCAAGDVPIVLDQCPFDQSVVRKRPPWTLTCPDGSPRNSDGNCPTPPRYCPDGSVPVNGQCQNPPPLQLGCPPGTVPTNDGTSCSSGGNPQICQRPKVMSDGQCVCPAGTVGNDCHKPVQCDSDEFLGDNGKCVEKPTRKTRKPRHRKPSQPSGETSKSPPIELNIGIGIGGGGHHGGHPSPRPMRPSGGG